MENIVIPEKKPTHVSVIGSCVSRDVFELCKTADGYTKDENSYVVDRFVQSINPVSAVSAPVRNDLADELIASSQMSRAVNFYKRCFMLDVTKKWFDLKVLFLQFHLKDLLI